MNLCCTAYAVRFIPALPIQEYAFALSVSLFCPSCHNTVRLSVTASVGLTQAVSAQQKALLSSPIKSVVCQHAGPVHALSVSPFDPTLVLSCGLDGQVKVCSGLIRQPLLELAPSDSYLFAAQWSPSRPMLLAVGAGKA